MVRACRATWAGVNAGKEGKADGGSAGKHECRTCRYP
jgi:hypothetical protein